MIATIMFPYNPMSPKSLPNKAVIKPISEMDAKIPTEKIRDVLKAFLVVKFSQPLIKPTIRGMLARWHGLIKTLNIPQIKAASNAIYKRNLKLRYLEL